MQMLAVALCQTKIGQIQQTNLHKTADNASTTHLPYISGYEETMKFQCNHIKLLPAVLT